jgi:predicted RNase H-like HicB family nuclease
MVHEYEAVVHPAVRVILEEGPRNWSAFAPSIPGCISTGKTREDVERNIEEALTFHLKDLHQTELEEINREAAEAEAAEHRA